jgi:uncharacterized protein (TIRG00374 family)
MRKIIIGLALLLGGYFLFVKKAEVQTIFETLQRGDWRFVLLSLLVLVVWLFNVAASYLSIYRALKINEKIEKLVVMAAAANFINVVAPSVGMGGMAVFISEAKRKGYSAARVTVAGVLYVLFEYVGFLCVLALGLLVLFRRNNLNSAELFASGILVSLAVFLAVMMVLGMYSASALGRVLAGLAGLVNRILRPFIGREYLSIQRAHAFAHDVAEGLHELKREPKNLLLPGALALSSKAVLIFILMLMFLAFKQPFSIGTLIGGFSIGYLFLIVSPTPAGIGVVEGALTLALRSLNVPLAAAAIIALSYRGITFWVPLLVGMGAFRWLAKGSETTKPVKSAPHWVNDL